MKSEMYVELNGKQINMDTQMNKFKELWKEQGGLVKDLKDVKLYINLEQHQVHYVVNDDTKGSFDIVE